MNETAMHQIRIAAVLEGRPPLARRKRGRGQGARKRRIRDRRINARLLQVSVNDWFLNQWPLVATFQTSYQQLLSALKASGRFTHIFAQTAGPATIVATNGFGQTLAQYRAGVTAAAAAVGGITVIDGTTLYTLAGSADNLHPSAAQQAAYATNLQAAMGF